MTVLYGILPPFLLATLRRRRAGSTALLPGGPPVVAALKVLGVAFLGVNVGLAWAR